MIAAVMLGLRQTHPYEPLAPVGTVVISRPDDVRGMEAHDLVGVAVRDRRIALDEVRTRAANVGIEPFHQHPYQTPPLIAFRDRRIRDVIGVRSACGARLRVSDEQWPIPQ